jgi:hypothetical protein
MLTQEDIRYFDDLDDMFGSAGWRHLVDEARKQIYQFQAEALEAKNFETVAYLRGQAEQLARLINLQDTTTSIRKASEDEDEE